MRLAQQIAAGERGIGQANQRDADLDLHRIDAQVVFHAGFSRFGHIRLFLRLGRCLGRRATAVRAQSRADARGPDSQERNPRQAGENQDGEETARHGQCLRPREELLDELVRQVAFVAAACDEQAGGQRDEERRHLAYQAVADRERGEERAGLSERHARLDHADEQPAHDVDERDDDAGDGVAADELAGTVHGPEKVGLLADFLAAALGLALVDGAGVQVGVDGHLPARHAVQGKSGSHFADARGAFGDHDELDDDDDCEDDQADDNFVNPGRTAGDELPESLDHAAGRHEAVGRGAGENQAGGGHVEHEPEERGGQQQRGEDAELQRRADVNRRQQHDYRNGDIRREK